MKLKLKKIFFATIVLLFVFIISLFVVLYSLKLLNQENRSMISQKAIVPAQTKSRSGSYFGLILSSVSRDEFVNQQAQKQTISLTLSIRNPNYKLPGGNMLESIEFINLIDDTNGYHTRLLHLLNKYEKISPSNSFATNKETLSQFSFGYDWWQGNKEDADLDSNSLFAIITSYPKIFGVPASASKFDIGIRELTKGNGVMYNDADGILQFDKFDDNSKLLENTLNLENEAAPVKLETLSFKVINNLYFNSFKRTFNDKKSKYTKVGDFYQINEKDGISLSLKLTQDLSQSKSQSVSYLLLAEILSDPVFYSKAATMNKGVFDGKIIVSNN